MSAIDKAQAELSKPRVAKKREIKQSDWLSSGSTLVNLACSDTIYGALAKGHYHWIAGASSSGKTAIIMTILAEAANNKNFDDYDLIHDDVERRMHFDVKKYYGQKLEDRLIAPRYDADGEPWPSVFIEDFYFGIDTRLKEVEQGKKPPFLWMLDSMDALTSKYEAKKFDQKKSDDEKGKKGAGDYGDGKAKINSTWIRGVISRLEATGCILVVVSQLRDNVGGGMFEENDITSGGRALKFYAAWQLWSKLGSAQKKTYKGKERQIGIISNIAIKKNSFTGQETTGDTIIKLPIYHSYGIDDIGSCVDFLVSEKAWPRDKTGMITADEFDFKGRRDSLIKKIEDEDLDVELRVLVKSTWNDIKEACKLDRKPRFN